VSASQCLDLFSVPSLLSPIYVWYVHIEREHSNYQLKSARQGADCLKHDPCMQVSPNVRGDKTRLRNV
jgi:hypothetical protein